MAEIVSDLLEGQRLAFLNALNDGDGLAEAAAYLEAGGDIDAAIVPIIEQTMLHHAAIQRRLELIEMLARRGANVDVRDAFGMTALHLAVTHEIDAMLMQWQGPGFPCARSLAEFGASFDARDNQDRTPRDIARTYGPIMLDLFDEVMT